MKIAAKALTALFVLALFIGIISAFAMAGAPPAIPTVPPSGGGGGGGGGGGYVPPEEIYPKINPIKNSLGIVIGNVTAKSASDIELKAEQKMNVSGQEFVLIIEAKLNSMQSDPKLDIIGEVPDRARLPSGLTIGDILTQINLTRFSNGWNIKPDSMKLTLKIPKALAANVDLNKSMLIRYDGSSYELLYPNVEGPDVNGTITFIVISPHESFKYNGFSEYMLVASVMPTATPSVAPPPTPTPTPEGGLSWLTITLALILVALVAIAFVLYFMMQRR